MIESIQFTELTLADLHITNNMTLNLHISTFITFAY
jgi:hypothetical protein